MLGTGTRGHKPGRAGTGFLAEESTTGNYTLTGYCWNSLRKTKDTPRQSGTKQDIYYRFRF